MAETKMQLADWFDDLCVRFIINIPNEELESPERICFQIEEAQWFYEDFIRPLDPTLPSLPLRTFSMYMFKHCPLLARFEPHYHELAFQQFLAYKTRVPVRGAILLNQKMDDVLLVRGWKKGASWSFPRGKINKDERDLDCAIREVYEETGYDIKAAGLVPEDESKVKFIEITIRDQHLKMYVFRGVSQDTVFEPRTRKEISKIEWYKVSQLPGYQKAKNNASTDHDGPQKPNKFYNVAPFLPQLKKWIAQQRRNEGRHARQASLAVGYPSDALEAYDTEENETQRHLQSLQTTAGGSTQHNTEQLYQTSQPFAQQFAAAPQIQSADASSELKRMLSVGQSQAPVEEPPPVPVSAADLLSMLRRSGPSKTPTQQQPPVQATMPPSNAYHYQSGQLAGQFSSSQNSTSYEMAANSTTPTNQIVMDEPAQFAQFSAPHSNFAPVQAQRSSHNGMTLQPTTLVQQSTPRHTQEPPLQLPAAYREAGDSQLAVDAQSPSQRQPTAPAASELPVPKLSNHALNLLNAFKGSSTGKNAEPGATRRPTVAELANLQTRQPQQFGNVHEQVMPAASRPMGHQHSESRSRQALAQAFAALKLPGKETPAQVDQQVREGQPSQQTQPLQSIQEAQASQTATAPSKQPQTARQNALLDLFRSSPQSRPTSQGKDASTKPTTSQLPQTQGSGQAQTEQAEGHEPDAVNQQTITSSNPVELPALPSLGHASQKKQLFDHKDGTMKDYLPQPRASGRPSNSPRASKEYSSSPLVSATLSGPPNVPEFGTTRRKHRSGKSTTDPGEGAAKEQGSSLQGPIQILRRPETPKEAPATEATSLEAKKSPKPAKLPENRRPVTPSTTQPSGAVVPTAELKGSTPKPFQPQILRRPPQQASPALPPGEPIETPTSPPPQSTAAELHSISNLAWSPPPADHATIATTVNAASAAFSRRPSSRTRQHTPSSPNLDRRASNTAEQKQTLLSLFGKAKSTSAATSPAPAAASAAAPPAPAPPTQDAAAKESTASQAQSQSRMASPVGGAAGQGASAAPELAALRTSVGPFSPLDAGSPDPAAATSGGDDPVRRGSGGLISPVDRGFLLNFLEGFAKAPPAAKR